MSASRAPSGEVLLKPVDVVVAVQNVVFAHQILEERDGRLDSSDDEFVERATQTHQTLVAISSVYDKFSREAVVVGRNSIARIHRRIEAHAKTARRMKL